MPELRGMPLTMAEAGRPVRLVRVNGGEGFCHRLAELGLTPGVEMTVVQDAGGPLMLCVRDSRIAVGRGMAHKMEVMLCEDCPANWIPEAVEGDEQAPDQGRERRLSGRGRGDCCSPDHGGPAKRKRR